MTTARGPSTRARGLAAESVACRHLERAGYRILARNARVGRGEIDAVAWDGDILCFVEVRSRADDAFGTPLHTVDRKKQERLVRAAHGWLVRNAAHARCRFDVVAVSGVAGDERVEIVRGAFEAPP